MRKLQAPNMTGNNKIIVITATTGELVQVRGLKPEPEPEPGPESAKQR